MTGRITAAGAEYFAALLFGQARDPIETYWVGLAGVVSPTIFTNGSELDEPDDLGSGYERQPIENNLGSWSTTGSSSLQRSNAVALTWDAAITDWGTMRYWALCSEQTDGDILAYGKITNPVDVNPLDVVTIGVGQLAFSVNVLFQVS